VSDVKVSVQSQLLCKLLQTTATAASHCRDAHCLAGETLLRGGGDSVKPTTETLSWGGRHLHGGGDCNTGTKSPAGGFHGRDSVM